MPQVLAKRVRAFAVLPLVLTLLFPVSPTAALEPEAFASPRVLFLLGLPFIAEWLTDTVPLDPEDDDPPPVDNGGAAIDPAGQPRPPGSGTGTGTGSTTGG